MQSKQVAYMQRMLFDKRDKNVCKIMSRNKVTV